jgi:hypothetical protein
MIFLYAIKFFTRCELYAGANQNDSWQANKPLLAAARFHQYPTSDGYLSFTNSLNELVQDIEQQMDSTNGWFCNDGILSDAEDQLKNVKKLLSSESQKKYVQSVIDRMDKIRSNHPSIKN